MKRTLLNKLNIAACTVGLLNIPLALVSGFWIARGIYVDYLLSMIAVFFWPIYAVGLYCAWTGKSVWIIQVSSVDRGELDAQTQTYEFTANGKYLMSFDFK